MNGLESPSELSELARRFPIHAGSWQKMLIAEKPVAFNLLYTVGRLREPATITIVNAFANLSSACLEQTKRLLPFDADACHIVRINDVKCSRNSTETIRYKWPAIEGPAELFSRIPYCT